MPVDDRERHAGHRTPIRLLTSRMTGWLWPGRRAAVGSGVVGRPIAAGGPAAQDGDDGRLWWVGAGRRRVPGRAGQWMCR